MTKDGITFQELLKKNNTIFTVKGYYYTYKLIDIAVVLCPRCFYRIVDITKPCAHCGCSVEEINAAIKRREEEDAIEHPLFL